MGHFLEAVWDRHYAKFVVICYWLLGMTNNFAYVIMLSAAHDILDDGQNKTNPSTKNTTNKYDCNELSTGTILLGKIINIKKKILEMSGIEPEAFRMRNGRSTTELHPLSC